jgi:hypothetical protein
MTFSILCRAARRAALLCTIALAASAASAAPDTRATAEIEHLLGTIARSDCTFIRGGKEYSGSEARKHLELKLGFVRGRIDSADQFVRDLASASSTTGEPYRIRCGAAQTSARAWLDAQLEAIRAAK